VSDVEFTASGGAAVVTGEEAGERAADWTATMGAAAEWRLLGLLFERPRAGWFEEVAQLRGEVGDGLLRDAADAAADAEEGTYLAVFGPGGCVSPREVAYRGRQDPGQLLADISGFHSAFGFRPAAEDSIDHVAVEASFAGFLAFKEAFARSQGDSEAADVCAQALAGFCDSHIRQFAEALALKLDAVGEAAPHLAQAAIALVERAGRAPAGALAAMTCEDEDGEMLCGVCTAG